jgi:hypothetical protein
MAYLTITSAGPTETTPGDFAARLAGNRLMVPEKIAAALAGLSVRRADELLAYLDTFPTAVAAALGWRVEQVLGARKQLVDALRGHVDAELISPRPALERPLGAFDPSELPSTDRH